MFNLRKKQETPQPQQIVTVEEIHHEFDTAVDRLLDEAKKIIGDGSLARKAERMKKIGFHNAKGVQEAAAAIKKEKEMEAALYYKQHYPFNKFITEEEVDRICEKYDLYKAAPWRFIGEIPEKNLREIEQFQLRREDRSYYAIRIHRTNSSGQVLPTRSYFGDGNWGAQGSFWGFGTMGQMGGGPSYLTFEQVQQYKDNPDYIIEERQQDLSICATKNLLNMERARTEGRNVVQDDPIVLCRLREQGCYLIVSKWGAEAADESLTNEKNN